MADLHSDQEIADAFHSLSKNPHTKLPKMRVGSGWLALVFLAISFIAAISFFILNTQRTEASRLEQSMHWVEQAIHSRIMTTSDLLSKTSIRLIHIPSVSTPVASAELSAMAFMQDRREVTDISIMTPDLTKLRSWSLSTNNTNIEDKALIEKHNQTLKSALEESRFGNVAVLSAPYAIDSSSDLFADLVLPTIIPRQFVIARLNLSALLNQVTYSLDTQEYLFWLMFDQPNIAGTTLSHQYFGPMENVSRITFGNLFSVKLHAQQKSSSLLSDANLAIWVISGLGLLLFFAIAQLLRLQHRQHQSMQRLAAEYSLRSAISESAIMGLRVTDREGRILYVNETFHKLFGFSNEELVGCMPPYPYWAEDISEQLNEIVNDHSQKLHTIEFLAKRKNGETFEGQLNVSELLDPNGRLLGYIGALYDITEQKRSAERMQAANDRFTRVVQSLMSAIAVVSDTEEHRLFFMNTSYLRLFGANQAGAERLIHKLNAEKRTALREGVFDEATNRWFDVRMQHITWANDEQAILMIATDITERRQMIRKLEAQQKMAEDTQRLITMGEMASSLAHELNQPLAAISNYASASAQMLQSNSLSADAALDALHRIDNQAKRAAAIIKRIRGFARKAQDTPLVPVAIETIIRETMELAVIQAKKLDAKLKLSIAPNLPELLGDAVMLEQLLLNLLKNAMEAVRTFENREVRLVAELDEADDHIVFTVRDHGPGIPDEQKEHLFEAFYTTKDFGMGIGLNICRTIIENHHGRISVRDTPGGGTTFIVRIPVSKIAEQVQEITQ